MQMSPAYLTSVSGLYKGLRFAYHMYGSGVGSLVLEVSGPESGVWIQVWQVTGQQQDSSTASWKQVDLEFQIPVEQVRFQGTAGSSDASAIAIGDVILKRGVRLGVRVQVMVESGCWELETAFNLGSGPDHRF